MDITADQAVNAQALPGINLLVWDVDVGRDNHVLIFYIVIYCHYAEHTDELQLER
jgi:hypothetical protein